MVEEKYLMPRGPWVSDEEMEAILATDADDDFERLCPAAPSRKRWLPLVAATLAGLALVLWPKGDDNEAVAYIYGSKVEDEQVAIEMMNATLAEVLVPGNSIENELSNILNAE